MYFTKAEDFCTDKMFKEERFKTKAKTDREIDWQSLWTLALKHEKGFEAPFDYSNEEIVL